MYACLVFWKKRVRAARWLVCPSFDSVSNTLFILSVSSWQDITFIVDVESPINGCTRENLPGFHDKLMNCLNGCFCFHHISIHLVKTALGRTCLRCTFSCWEQVERTVVSSSCHDCRLLCPRAIKAVKGTNKWNWPCKQLYICSHLWRNKDNGLRWLVAGIDLITNGTIQHLSCAALFILLNCVIAVCTLEWPKSWCKRCIWEILCCFICLPCWEQDLSTVLGARFLRL
jgi:hypothetical protein